MSGTAADCSPLVPHVAVSLGDITALLDAGGGAPSQQTKAAASRIIDDLEALQRRCSPERYAASFGLRRCPVAAALWQKPSRHGRRLLGARRR